MSNEIATRGPTAAAKKHDEPEVVRMLQAMGPQIARALPRHVSSERMARVALTALRATPKLLTCTTASVLGSVLSAAQLGLEPNTPLGLAYLVPYGNTCQLIVGYQGFLELARRSGLVTSVYAHVVRAGDDFRYSLGLELTLHHVPLDKPDREQKEITHVYAVARMRDSDPIFVVLTAAQVEARRQRSRAKNDGPWKTDYEAMALKSGIRALWRWLPKTAEMAVAAALEDAHDRSAPQSESWDPATLDAFREQGVVVDAEALTPPAEEAEAPAAPKGSKAARVLAAVGKAKDAAPAPLASGAALVGAAGVPVPPGAPVPVVDAEAAELGYEREPGAEG